MTFPGASLRLVWVDSIAGSSVDAEALMFAADGADTVTAGDVFDAYCYDDWGLPVDPETEVVLSWVILTGDGSDGTLTLSSGREESDLTGIGSVSVSGAQEVVRAAAGFSYADLIEGWGARLRVEVESGSATIRQIKLRVWPASGIRGRWVPGASFDYEVPWLTLQTGNGGGGEYIDDNSSVTVAWVTAEASASTTMEAGLGAAQTGRIVYRSQPSFPESAFAQAEQTNTASWNGVPGAPATASSVMSKALLYVTAPEPGVVSTVPAATAPHPDYVVGEPGGTVRAPGGGVVEEQPAGWLSPALEVQVHPTDYPLGPFDVEYGTVEPPATYFDGVQWATDQGLPVPLAENTTLLGRGLTDGEYPISPGVHNFVVIVSPPGLFVTQPANPEFDSDGAGETWQGSGSVRASFTGSYRMTVPPHYYWSTEGEKWLRGVQRNDGLSHSVPRGVQVSSRQRSLRGVGYQ